MATVTPVVPPGDKPDGSASNLAGSTREAHCQRFPGELPPDNKPGSKVGAENGRRRDKRTESGPIFAG